MKILVVDDDPVVRKVTGTMLDIRGHGVLTAANGEDALKMAALHKPDLIIMDVFMPGLNGLAVIELLKADPATKDIPTLIVSGTPAEEISGEARARGAFAFLQKPYPIKDLMDLVAKRK